MDIYLGAWAVQHQSGKSAIRKAETLAARAHSHPSDTPVQDTGPDEDCTEEQGWQELLDSSVVASRDQH